MEILYKAKRKENGEWVEGFPVIFSNKAAGILKTNCFYFSENTDELEIVEIVSDTICQFTGLLDYNDDKIFLKDLLRNRVLDRAYKVECLKGNLKIMAIDDSFVMDWSLFDEHYGFAVAGNIHDEAK